MAHIFVDGETLTAKQLNDNFTEIRNNTNTRLTALERKTGWTAIDPSHFSAPFREHSFIQYNVSSGIVHLRGKLAVSSNFLVQDYREVFKVRPGEILPLEDVITTVVLRRTTAGSVPLYQASGALQVVSATGWVHLYVKEPGMGAAFINLSWPL